MIHAAALYVVASLTEEVQGCQEHSNSVKATQEAVQSLKTMGLNLVHQKVEFFVTAWSAIVSACVELKTSMDDAKNIGLVVSLLIIMIYQCFSYYRSYCSQFQRPFRWSSTR